MHPLLRRGVRIAAAEDGVPASEWLHRVVLSELRGRGLDPFAGAAREVPDHAAG
jgi:hypothetical protein